jgi:RNA-directed DNA polymerase
LLKEILNRQHLEKAMLQVMRNRGSGGVDGMQTDELRDFLSRHYQKLKEEITTGNYTPSPVRKVAIPKPQGGTRMLGIPTVIDRLLQQAIAQWLSPKYEATFSENSYGFRPKRNAHQAVMQAKHYLQEGKTWVIEIDLEKFFDKVNHDRLLSTLSKRISDKPTLQLIRSYLTSGIMEGGTVSQRTEGTPQGSPLSPLLSNIVLDELDKELTKRGHSFVRYADDSSIYVRSEKAAQRVRASITRYIEEQLLLKVNETKKKNQSPTSKYVIRFFILPTKREMGDTDSNKINRTHHRKMQSINPTQRWHICKTENHQTATNSNRMGQLLCNSQWQKCNAKIG